MTQRKGKKVVSKKEGAKIYVYTASREPKVIREDQVNNLFNQEPHIVDVDSKQLRLCFQVDLTDLSVDLAPEVIETLREMSERFFIFFDKRPTDKVADAIIKRKAQRILAFAEFIHAFRGQLSEEFSTEGKYGTRAHEFMQMKLGEAYTLSEERGTKADSQEVKELRKEIHKGFASLAKESQAFKESLEELRQKRTYRRREHVTANGRQVGVPDHLAIITHESYRGAMAPLASYMNEANGQYLSFYDYQSDELDDDGKIVSADAANVYLTDMTTGHPIGQLDIPFLSVVFSAIHDDFKKSDFARYKEVISFYAPEMVQRMRTDKDKKAVSGITDEDVEQLIKKMTSFHNVAGIITEPSGRKSIYPVLNFSGYDAEKNTISVQSPYLCRLVDDLHRVSAKKDKKGRETLEGGKEQYAPTVTRLAHMSIESERNKIAVGIVFRCLQTIEAAGPKGTPHIAAKTLVEEVPGFADRLNGQKNQRRFLCRSFKKAWELLPAQTDIQKKYAGIVLPSPTDPACIPNMSTLDSMVFQFPHKGIAKTWGN